MSFGSPLHLSEDDPLASLRKNSSSLLDGIRKSEKSVEELCEIVRDVLLEAVQSHADEDNDTVEIDTIMRDVQAAVQVLLQLTGVNTREGVRIKSAFLVYLTAASIEEGYPDITFESVCKDAGSIGSADGCTEARVTIATDQREFFAIENAFAVIGQIENPAVRIEQYLSIAERLSHGGAEASKVTRLDRAWRAALRTLQVSITVISADRAASSIRRLAVLQVRNDAIVAMKRDPRWSMQEETEWLIKTFRTIPKLGDDETHKGDSCELN